jgi:hypothetical protein
VGRVIEYRTCLGVLKFERRSDGSLMPVDLLQQLSVPTVDTTSRFTRDRCEVVFTETVDVEGSDDRDARQGERVPARSL